MSKPIWCDVRQHYCRCQDFGKRCDDKLEPLLPDVPFDEKDVAALISPAAEDEKAK